MWCIDSQVEGGNLDAIFSKFCFALHLFNVLEIFDHTFAAI